MKVGGPPVIDHSRLLEQVYRAKTAPSALETTSRLLDPGTLLKGRVLGSDQAGILTIATERGSFTATSSKALAVGQEFWFQVVQTGSGPLLVEAGKANAVLDLLRVLLPEMLAEVGGGTKALLGANGTQSGTAPELTAGDLRLLQLLTANALDGQADPGKLIKLISQLQLSQPLDEKTLASASKGAMPATDDLASPVLQKLARLLEGHATLNQQPPAATGSDYYLFPVFFAEQAGRGEWLFSYEQTGGQGDAAFETTISFYLTMTQLGDIHLAITSGPKALSGVFTLTTKAAADHVRQLLPQLTAALSPLADNVVITCRTAQFDYLKTMKDDLTAKVGLLHFGLVDVKA
jgi:hypothetical protein